MRLALLSDMHGNPIALDAVLADVERSGGADSYHVLGDISALGYDPIGVLERLIPLPGVRFVRGNTERYFVTGERPPPLLEDAQRDASLVPLVVEVSNSFAWAQGALAVSGWLEWLAALPLDDRILLPDGTRVHCVHASPGRDDGRGCHIDAPDEELTEVVSGLAEDVLCVGHTHLAFDRAIDGKRIVNLGAVSNPHRGDKRATYVVIEADPSGFAVEHRRVEYDYGAVLDAIRASRHPNPAFLGHFFAP
jgi:predicted phosphodiesterase